MRIILLAIGLFLISCSTTSNRDGETKKLSYSYELNGCATGTKTFSLQSQLCEGLLNEALNSGCAQEMRFEHYRRDCGILPVEEVSTPDIQVEQPATTVPETPTVNNEDEEPVAEQPVAEQPEQEPEDDKIEKLTLTADGEITFTDPVAIDDARGNTTYTSVVTITFSGYEASVEGFEENFVLNSRYRFYEPPMNGCDKGEMDGVIQPSGLSIIQFTLSGSALCRSGFTDLELSTEAAISAFAAVSQSGTTVSEFELKIKKTN